MKGSPTWIAVLALAALAGCEPAPGQPHGKSLVNEWLMRSYSEDAIKNAIIAQHTLYAYHFENNSASLNELGEHDVAILIAHFKENPGRLNVRWGEESRKLHSARVKTVVDALKKGAVEVAGVEFADAFPGGDGMASERVVKILIGQQPSRRQAAASTAGRTETTVSRTGIE